MEAVEYQKILKKALFLIYTNRDLERSAPWLVKDSRSLWDELEVVSLSAGHKLPFSVRVPIGTPLERDVLKYSNVVISIEGSLEIGKEIKQTCALLIIGDGPDGYCCKVGEESRRSIIRRFHFDVDEGIIGVEEQRWTPSHLQYGGTRREPGIHSCLHPKMRFPRIPFPPMDLILLIDLCLQQFSPDLKGFFMSAKWRKAVIATEDLWQKGYYARISKYFEYEGTRVGTPLYKTLSKHVLE